MSKFYEAQVKYLSITPEGAQKTVSEQYVFDAVSIGDCEAKMTEYIEPYVNGEMDITSIKLSKFSEFVPKNVLASSKIINSKTIEIPGEAINQDDDKYFAVKISFVTLDEAKVKEKKTPYHYLVQANSVENANKTVFLHMHGTLADWEINNIVETKIVDVIIN